MAKNLVNHSRAQHIDMKYHRIHDEVNTGTIKVEYCSTLSMFAELLTKGLFGQDTRNLLVILSEIQDIANVEEGYCISVYHINVCDCKTN